MSKLGQTLSQYWHKIQGTLFPMLEEELDPLTAKQQRLVTILELIRIEQFVRDSFGCEGRPLKARAAIARSFVAKMVYNIATTSALWERLHSDTSLRRICGFETKHQIPSEASFSRAFAEFSESQIPQRVHEALIKKTLGDTETIVVHNSRDSTAIEAREKPVRKDREHVSTQAVTKKKRGRPKTGEEKPLQEPTRIEKQRTMSLQDMLENLPKDCNIGSKKNSKGHIEHWIGYKLHLDTGDGGIPISAILTSASLHDSQVAIPLASMTAQRVINLYDLMDAAYDAPGIIEHSRSLGHVPLVDKNPRRDKAFAEELEAELKRQKLINLVSPKTVRYNERTTAERTNARLKDEFGGRMVRVRGHAKVMCHLMFGVVVLAADQIMRLVT
ncbi:MAG: transposase [Rhabdochlamydiaceae bacterium]